MEGPLMKLSYMSKKNVELKKVYDDSAWRTNSKVGEREIVEARFRFLKKDAHRLVVHPED